jgi:RNase H-like protein
MQKVLLYDIETFPNVAFVWGKYEQDVIAYQSEGYMLTWSAKWLGGKQITRGLCDYKNKKQLVTDLHKLISEADIIVAHNGDRFDVRKMNTEFIAHGLNPPEPYKTVDTKKVAKRYFAFNSNKLDDLGAFLKVGRKVKHPGFELWLGCEQGDKASWNLMKKYNKQDVLLLEKIYLKLRPWMTSHPYQGGLCDSCGGDHLQRRGVAVTKSKKLQRWQCLDCGAWSQTKYEDSSQN